MPDHSSVTDSNGIGIQPDKVLSVDLSLFLIPSDGRCLLTVPSLVVLSSTLDLLGRGGDSKCIVTATRFVRSGHADVVGTAVGYPGHAHAPFLICFKNCSGVSVKPLLCEKHKRIEVSEGNLLIQLALNLPLFTLFSLIALRNLGIFVLALALSSDDNAR